VRLALRGRGGERRRLQILQEHIDGAVVNRFARDDLDRLLQRLSHAFDLFEIDALAQVLILSDGGYGWRQNGNNHLVFAMVMVVYGRRA